MSTTASQPPPSSLLDAVHMIRIRRLQQREYSDEEIHWWVHQFTHDHTPRYQMSAWLMAVCCNGLSARETATLTKCMMESGVQIPWRSPTAASPSGSSSDFHLVDKHSTGGVGDKISILLAPMVASLGLKVPMMAGRGLAHTGGTIDKLESIPGFRCNLSVQEIQDIVMSETGGVITGATPEMCPADRKMYALRDVTDTVSSIPLITASIMSKKIAENPDSIVLDVKYGLAAFMESFDDAAKLAESLIATGEANGLNPTTAFLTRMDSPLGYTVGNWLEVRECIEIMNGKFDRLSRDLIELTLVEAAEMMLQSGKFGTDFDSCMQQALATLQDGRALQQFRKMAIAQGGDPTIAVDKPDEYPLPAPVETLTATSDGYITSIHALMVGQVCVQLGAGRSQAEHAVDPVAGILFHKQVGDSVKVGDKIADVYTSKSSDVVQLALERLQTATIIAKEKPDNLPIVSHRVTSQNGVKEFTIPNVDF